MRTPLPGVHFKTSADAGDPGKGELGPKMLMDSGNISLNGTGPRVKTPLPGTPTAPTGVKTSAPPAIAKLPPKLMGGGPRGPGISMG